jgi:hypothetical protein
MSTQLAALHQHGRTLLVTVTTPLSLLPAAVTQSRMTLQIKQLPFPTEQYEAMPLEHPRQLPKLFLLARGQASAQVSLRIWELAELLRAALMIGPAFLISAQQVSLKAPEQKVEFSFHVMREQTQCGLAFGILTTHNMVNVLELA